MIKPKILIVEDNKTLADSIGAACELDAMEPMVVYNGEDALAAFHEHNNLSFVVLDILLPDISGFDICRRIREKSKVPIVFMTSRTALPDEISGLEMGADGYLKKPVSPRAVVSHIRATLRRANEWSKQEKSSDEEKEYTPHPAFEINDETRTILFFKQPLNLSNTLFITLSLFIRHPGRVYSRQQLIEMVDEDVVLELRSADTRIFRIRQEIAKINPDIDVFKVHPGVGYSLKKHFL